MAPPRPGPWAQKFEGSPWLALQCSERETPKADSASDLIVQRGQELLIAADWAWPFDLPTSAAARREFGLPANRPYVP
jgi:hypothetical protein